MEYAINAGQDCSSFLLIDYIGMKKLPFFFDRLAVYSDDWVKVFSQSFIQQVEMKPSVFLKQFPKEMYNMYIDCNENGFDCKKRRIVFHGCVGDKYNKVYFDVRHIDDNCLKGFLDLSSFQKFIESIQDNVVQEITRLIDENVNATRLLYEKHRSDEIVFFRTIKHLMSKQERDHILQVKSQIRQMFPNSKLLVISDVLENASPHDDIIHFEFNHWYKNDNDKERFFELFQKWKCGDLT